MTTVFFLQISCQIVILSLSTLRIQSESTVAWPRFSLLTSSRDGTVVAEALGNLSNCRVLYVPHWLWMFWVVILSFECLLCYLAIFKACERVKSTGHMPFSPRNLQNILLRDSVIYYILWVNFLYRIHGTHRLRQDCHSLFYQPGFLGQRISWERLFLDLINVTERVGISPIRWTSWRDSRLRYLAWWGVALWSTCGAPITSYWITPYRRQKYPWTSRIPMPRWSVWMNHQHLLALISLFC